MEPKAPNWPMIWVKVFTTEYEDEVRLEDLLGENPLIRQSDVIFGARRAAVRAEPDGGGQFQRRRIIGDPTQDDPGQDLLDCRTGNAPDYAVFNCLADLLKRGGDIVAIECSLAALGKGRRHQFAVVVEQFAGNW